MAPFKAQRTLLIPILIIIGVFLISWWARTTIDQTMDLLSRLTVIEGFFSITHVHNPGAAFGIFSKLDPSYRFPLLLCISFIALLFIGYLLIKNSEGDWAIKLGLSLLAGGALGNLYERIIYGEVVDYFDFYLGNYHWPAFNMADVFISTGIGFILLYTFFERGR